MIMEEIWKDIPGFEGFYQVSNFGNVKTVGRYGYNPGSRRTKPFKFWIKERVLRPDVNTSGYKYVILCVDSNKKPIMIHTAVAITFLGERTKNMSIDHIDGNKMNNCVSNLEYVTYRENNLRAYRTGCKKIGRESSKSKIKTEEQEDRIIYLRYIEKLTYNEISKIMGVSKTTVYRCLLRRYAYKNIGRVSRPRGPYKKHMD